MKCARCPGELILHNEQRGKVFLCPRCRAVFPLSFRDKDKDDVSTQRPLTYARDVR